MAGEVRERTLTKNTNAVVRFVVEHVALLVPFVGAEIFYTRCVAVSRGDVYTAFVVLSQSSIADALRALTFTAIPLAFLIASLVATFAASERVVLSGEVARPVTLLLVLVAVLGIFAFFFFQGFGSAVASVFALVYLAVVTITLTFMYFLGVGVRKDDAVDELRWAIRRGMTLMVSAVLLFGVWTTLFNESVWLPSERLVFRNEAPITGYILKTSDAHVVVLRDDPRIVVERPAPDLLDRKFCVGFEIADEQVQHDLPKCP
jgi:hypothetical protein